MHFDFKTNGFYKDNKKYDLNEMKWTGTDFYPEEAVEISYIEALKIIQKTGNKVKIPIGVIGSNKPDPEQYQIAEEIGEKLAELGLSVICGGRAGVMEAVCKGVKKRNGISIGILPETNLDNVNSYVTIPLATGIGFARNAVISSSSFCLIAIGGGNGTLSEIAYGLQFGKKVFSIKCNLSVNDLVKCKNVNEIITNICKAIIYADTIK